MGRGKLSFWNTRAQAATLKPASVVFKLQPEALEIHTLVSKGSAKRRYSLLPQELGAGSSLSYAMRRLGKPHRCAAALGK